MIIINEPYIEYNKNNARLCSQIIEDNIVKKVYLEVDKKYQKYLCYERSDAFLIVLFYYAMKKKKNIICKAPVTQDLFYQITNYLIPIFKKNSHNVLEEIKIETQLADNIDNIGAVGTGLTCGVDSFYTIFDSINHTIERNKLTHLVIMSIADSYKKDGKYKKISTDLYNKANECAKKLNLPIIKIKSNMREIFPIPPMHTLIRLYGIYALQKLFGIYYFSSGYPIWSFNLEDCSSIDSARYDLLICKELSTKNLFIYSYGSQLNRIDKLKYISKYDLVKKNLHVCTIDSKNCSKCGKCIRTMVCLDAINELDNFKDVFDTKYYYSNIDYYFKNIVESYNNSDLFVFEFIDLLRKKYQNNKILNKTLLDKEGICNRCYRISDYNKYCNLTNKDS